jgi:hypothetical protein
MRGYVFNKGSLVWRCVCVGERKREDKTILFDIHFNF